MHSAPRVVSSFVVSFPVDEFPGLSRYNKHHAATASADWRICRVHGKDVVIDGKIRWALGRNDVLN